MNQIQGVSYYERMPVIMDPKKQDSKFYCYDGKEYGFLSNEERIKIRKIKDKESGSLTPYILVTKDKDDKRSLEDIYKEFVRDAEEMKKETEGIVNMYKTGRDSQTAIHTAFHFLNQKRIYAEPISVDEAEWIQKASQGALRFGEKYQGKAWKYDINSSYPSIYSSPKFLIPIKKGEFKTMTKEEFEDSKFFPTGIYRAKVNYPDQVKPYWKVFQQNKNNYYTHLDLSFAKSKNFKIDLICDGKSNFLSYSRDKCKLGSECFKEFVNLLYQLRKNPIIKKRCKSLLAKLWGSLSQSNSFSKVLHIDQEYELPADLTILSGPNLINDYKYELMLCPKNKPFETNWARMKPFLLSKGRIKIAEAIYPHMDHVKRCHTDSMVSDKDLKIKDSTKLGEFKFEGFCADCTIVNSQTMKGIFTK